jgi:hypothetical protein
VNWVTPRTRGIDELGSRVAEQVTGPRPSSSWPACEPRETWSSCWSGSNARRLAQASPDSSALPTPRDEDPRRCPGTRPDSPRAAKARCGRTASRGLYATALLSASDDSDESHGSPRVLADRGDFPARAFDFSRRPLFSGGRQPHISDWRTRYRANSPRDRRLNRDWAHCGIGLISPGSVRGPLPPLLASAVVGEMPPL